MREEKAFRVVVFRFETDASTNYTRYMITKNYMPFFPGNQWLELKSIRKTSTGKEYAKKLVAFLNWLDSRKVTYENATNHHVREFLHELVFGNLADEKVLSLQSSVGYSTLTKYVTVITGFYGWLDDMRQTEMLWKKKSVQANCSFLYGQIYSREYRYLIDGYAARLKSSRDYTKWYDKATKELLCLKTYAYWKHICRGWPLPLLRSENRYPIVHCCFQCSITKCLLCRYMIQHSRKCFLRLWSRNVLSNGNFSLQVILQK